MKKESPELTQNLKNQLLKFDYPGNIRELKNIIERLIIFNKNNKILDIIEEEAESAVNSVKKKTEISSPEKNDITDLKKANELAKLKDIEREYILKVFESVQFNKDKTAKILGISRKTLWLKLKEYLQPERQ